MKPSKYRNKWTEYGGQRYQSKREAAFAAELDLRVKVRDIKSWRRQVPIPLRIGDALICKYTVDFVIHHNNDDLEYCEVKGYWTSEAKLKWKLFQAIWPDLRTSIVK